MELRRSKQTQSGSSTNTIAVKMSGLRETKKRKTREGNNGIQDKEQAKSGQGLLKEMMEMPMDVLLEIFGLLEPLDLLHIARTTKALRAILMSRTSTFVWRSARSNIVGLPDCPDDLSEPQYTALMFVARCTFCQRSIPCVPVSWYARVRCCTECIEFNFTPVAQRPSADRGCPALLSDWVPFVYVKSTTSSKTKWTIYPDSGTLFISMHTENQWRDEYWAFKDPKSQHEWLLRTIEARYIVQKHARACALWHNSWSRSADVNYLQQFSERNAQIMGHIKGISVEEELYKIPPTKRHPLDIPKIRALWNSRGLSVQHCISLTPSLNYLLSTELSKSEKRRESLAYRDLLTSRKSFLCAIYNDGIKTLAMNSPSPTLAQIYHVVENHDLVDYSMSVEKALRVPFNEVIALWRKHVDRKFVDIIVNACGSEYEFDPATVLDLATTFFRCHYCYHDNPSPPMRRDEAMTHPCLEMDALTDDDPYPVFRQVFGSAGSNHGYLSNEFSQEDLKIMQEAVEMCSLDPKVTTAPQMDELDPIFECRECNSFEKGRATMSWTAVLRHQQMSHRASPKIHALRILEEPNATKVRERIKEEQMRLTYQGYCLSYVVCPHCRSVLDGLKLYRQHLKGEHGISKIKYEELVYWYQQSRIPPEYRLLPPLDEESDGL